MEGEGGHDNPLEDGFRSLVRLPRSDDLSGIESVLARWLQPHQSEHIRSLVEESIAGKNAIRYVVAETDGTLVGIMGFLPLARRASWHITDDAEANVLGTLIASNAAAELTNAYVAPEDRAGKGVGSALLDELEKIAVREGYSRMYVTSGAAARESAWPFYDKRFDARIGTRQDTKGNLVPIWVKHLRRGS